MQQGGPSGEGAANEVERRREACLRQEERENEREHEHEHKHDLTGHRQSRRLAVTHVRSRNSTGSSQSTPFAAVPTASIMTEDLDFFRTRTCVTCQIYDKTAQNPIPTGSFEPLPVERLWIINHGR